MNDIELLYRQAQQTAQAGRVSEAQSMYEQLLPQISGGSLRALVLSDLGSLSALKGDLLTAIKHFRLALVADSNCRAARFNLQAIGEAENGPPSSGNNAAAVHTRIAILSLLFNWPSTGGGIIHTVETGQFLQRAGYEVRHFYAQHPEWGLGKVTQATPAPSEAIAFDSASWEATEIQRRFRQAVDAFHPHFVIITDSWNFKPLLAEAVQGYRYFLRLAAQEGLCPLNNVRLLVNNEGQTSCCPQHQLATPKFCQQCVHERQRFSGRLHQAERDLAGYGTTEYDQKLRQAFSNAEAVLVVNPLIAAMVSPFAKQVRVVPSGFDPDRFPWTEETEAEPPSPAGPCTRLVFAGLTQEYMKGFHILRAACSKLWRKRRDFELVATGDTIEGAEEFVTFIGWQSQEELPRVIRAADILVFPTIAEEALGRSAVEAMGAGRPVIASRIGGLQFTVIDGATGLLFAPGDADDLARQIEALLDNPELRLRLGRAGRQRFEDHFTWDKILQHHYLPLLGPPLRARITGR